MSIRKKPERLTVIEGVSRVWANEVETSTASIMTPSRDRQERHRNARTDMERSFRTSAGVFGAGREVRNVAGFAPAGGAGAAPAMGSSEKCGELLRRRSRTVRPRSPCRETNFPCKNTTFCGKGKQNALLGVSNARTGTFRCCRRGRPRRSEERRVGKECRSRWSPYH